MASAPLSAKHHVNVSPKSPGTSVIVLDPHTVAYLDLTGSGSETAAHVLENERLTLMFCNLEEGLPKILRIFGTASFIVQSQVPFQWLERFPSDMVASPGFLGVFKLNVHCISTSCGYSLPVMTYEKHRSVLDEFTNNKGQEGMKEYRLKKNSFSIDGLPSLDHLDHSHDDDKVIVEEPTEGYVYAKIVKRGSEEFRLAQRRRRNLPCAATIKTSITQIPTLCWQLGSCWVPSFRDLQSVSRSCRPCTFPFLFSRLG